MKLPVPEGTHLTYCTNIYPGESWPEVLEILTSKVPAVKRLVAPREPFGVGLRLAARAAAELERPGSLERAREALTASSLYVFTLNGFPFGAFHGERVKERVYRPDWLEEQRLEYTRTLSRVLALLLPENVPGSISTVPGCFGPRAGEGSARSMAMNVARAAADLLQIQRASGKSIALALEPEAGCYLETTADAVRFFETELWHPETLAFFGRQVGLDVQGAEHALRRHVGVCLDACHAAVQFESPREALGVLKRAGIAVPKIQVSAGLRLVSPDADALENLRAFDDGVYFHQVVVRRSDGTLVRFLDLPDAIAAAAELGSGSEWRVHFHVPVFESRLGPFSSTQPELSELLNDAEELAPALEVETYTFGVLPEAYRARNVSEAVARELVWTADALAVRRTAV